MSEVVLIEFAPSVPGHGGWTRMYRARRKAMSADGRYWLVRRRGIFRRWRWLPTHDQRKESNE